MSEAHLNEYDHYNFDQDKHVNMSGHSGKGKGLFLFCIFSFEILIVSLQCLRSLLEVSRKSFRSLSVSLAIHLIKLRAYFIKPAEHKIFRLVVVVITLWMKE